MLWCAGLFFCMLISEVIYMQRYVDTLCSLGLTRADAAIVARDFIKELDFDGLHNYIAELQEIRGRYKKSTVNEVLDEIGLERI